MVTVIIHLGSNQGDRARNINSAYNLLESEIGKITSYSSLYETAPWGNLNQDNFLNSAIILVTTVSPFEILAKTQKIEVQLGRTKNVKWAPRIIDIDLIFYGDLILYCSALTIPHSQYDERNFVLQPLQCGTYPNLGGPKKK